MSGQPPCQRGWRLATAVGSDALANSSHPIRRVTS